MIRDDTDKLMEIEAEVVPQDQSNAWLKFLGGGTKPRPALEGRLLPKPKNTLVSSRQQRGVGYGK
jgi:hypothetical protein